MQDKLMKIYSNVRKMTDFTPEVAVVLGSGNGAFADAVEKELTLPYSEIEGFPRSTVSGHAGSFVFGKIGGVKTAVMSGRVHYYEGYSMQDTVLPIRLLRLLGAHTAVLTNAAGSLHEHIPENSLMAISDHLSCFAPSPLLGENFGELGARFPDMTEVYDRELLYFMHSFARENGIALHEGVYAQLTGPQYETPAEIRMLRTLGAHAVGMSTAAEAIAARHAGMRTVGISRISNMAAGMRNKALDHGEVSATPKEVLKSLNSLLIALVAHCGKM